MASLVKSLETFFLTHGLEATYWLALSGGMDSEALVAIAATLSKHLPLKLRPVHIHHGLSPYADQWEQHCQSVCSDLGLALHVIHLNLNPGRGKSREAIAREARYRALAGCLGHGDYLLTAHHVDDQAETLLIQLLRGAGLPGLAAMPVLKPLGLGWHARPWLTVPRARIHAYAKQALRSWVEDESNEDEAFTRNFLRRRILPLLRERWPGVSETLARTASHCAEAHTLLQALMEQDRAACQGRKPHTLNLKAWLMLDDMRQRYVLRTWLKANCREVPSLVKLTQIQRQMREAALDKRPVVAWEGGEVRRFGDELFYCAHPLPSAPQPFAGEWDFKTVYTIPMIGELSAVLSKGQGLRKDIGNVRVKLRSAGDYCRLPGRRHRHRLKKLMQAWRIPPWERHATPLLFVDDTLIAAVGYFIDQAFLAAPLEEGYTLSFTPF